MICRNSFVTNSSSTNYLIVNKSSESKDLIDFVKENPDIVTRFCEEYDWFDYDQADMLKSAASNNETFRPKERKVISFGDGDGTIIGNVFDYMLRSGGSSKSFDWYFKEMLR